MWRINIQAPDQWLLGIFRGQTIEEEIQSKELETIQIGFLLFSLEIFWNKQTECHAR